VLATARTVPTSIMSPLPYNVLVTLGVWRAAERATPVRRDLARIAALLWLIAATLL
jgi:hypothetical protein